MNLIRINSKTLLVRIPKIGFEGSLPEVEKYAIELKQYGNILSYNIDSTRHDHLAYIYFHLKDDWFSFEE